MGKNNLSFKKKSEVKFQNTGKGNGIALQNPVNAMALLLTSTYVNQPVAFNECF